MFGPDPTNGAPLVALWWRLAVPAVACLLALAVVNEHSVPPGAPKVIALWGAQLPVETLASMNLGRNVFAAFGGPMGPPFDWTNGSPSRSTSGSFLPIQTNGL
ncbi:MAG: hypothetical protein HY301_02455 [Verrucomicrobia bacterium]|nr:hypothetical protein [Verrucomicrobiota bacterium]